MIQAPLVTIFVRHGAGCSHRVARAASTSAGPTTANSTGAANTRSWVGAERAKREVELSYENLFLVRKGQASLTAFDKTLQGVLRANPEAFFARKVLVVEGQTEEGIALIRGGLDAQGNFVSLTVLYNIRSHYIKACVFH